MDVFISWSGPRSGAAAEALRTWLPKIINAIKPWLSSADIDKGARWSSDIAVRLESAKAGIICLTPGNLHSDWILFEAGALSKTIQKTYVCPLLIDLEPTDVKGPLAQFQATRVVKGDVLKLIKTLNSGLDQDALSDGHIEEAFEVWWPKLDSQLKTLPTESTSAQPPRTDRDVLEEILGFVRNQNRAPGTSLADEDRWVILNSRAWKALRAVHGGVGGAINSLGTRGNDIRFDIRTTIEGKPRTYILAVPAEATPSEIEASVLSQIKEADRLNNEPPPERAKLIATVVP
jgi:TIR domain